MADNSTKMVGGGVPFPARANLKGGTTEQISEAARLMGAITTERKRASSAANGWLVRNPGRKLAPLETLDCTCGGDGLDHRSYCPRGRAIRRRQKAGILPFEDAHPAPVIVTAETAATIVCSVGELTKPTHIEQTPPSDDVQSRVLRALTEARLLRESNGE